MYYTFQPTQFPTLNSEVYWDTQLSQDYIENNAKIRIGRSAYQFEQLYSSQATENMQELLLKVALKCPDIDHEYKVDFQHRVSLTNQCFFFLHYSVSSVNK